VCSERQTTIALREVKQWKYETMEDYYDNFLQLCVIPQQQNDAYLRETCGEGLRLKLKLAIMGMSRATTRATIVKVANLAREIEEEMPTTCKSR
jgi:hypothetical protein